METVQPTHQNTVNHLRSTQLQQGSNNVPLQQPTKLQQQQQQQHIKGLSYPIAGKTRHRLNKFEKIRRESLAALFRKLECVVDEVLGTENVGLFYF